MSEKIELVINEKTREVLNILKAKTQKKSDAEVFLDALRIYVWVVRRSEAGYDIFGQGGQCQGGMKPDIPFADKESDKS